MFTPGQEIEIARNGQYFQVWYVGRSQRGSVVYEGIMGEILCIDPRHCRHPKKKKEGWIAIMQYEYGTHHKWTTGPYESFIAAREVANKLGSSKLITITKVEWEE